MRDYPDDGAAPEAAPPQARDATPHRSRALTTRPPDPSAPRPPSANDPETRDATPPRSSAPAAAGPVPARDDVPRREPEPGGPTAREAVAHAQLETALASHPGRIALVSAFGAESVVLLHMVARLDPATPVLFGETGMLFAETLAYRREVADGLGLTDVRHLRPDPADLAAEDPDGALHRRDDRACCHLRKVRPLERALAGFDAWITGRKRMQSATRAALPFAERDGAGRLKLNPLADWSPREIAAYMDRHALPRHPLVAKGYPSIGCAPCTTPVAPGESPRAGRWRGRDRDECGIHFVDGRAVRVAGAPMDRL